VAIVINGAVRDVDSIRALDLPLYAAGVTHRGPYKDGPGEINVPVALDGMVVEPGDLVLGDADGVLAVPRLAAAEILALAEAKQAAETREMAAIREGTSDRSWVDKTLQARGCSIED
jgi:regulator of RNase E activity RraA